MIEVDRKVRSGEEEGGAFTVQIRATLTRVRGAPLTPLGVHTRTSAALMKVNNARLRNV
jgi:hypothetical protein